MTYTPRILAFAGSTREKSYNKQLIKIAIAGARSAGAEVTLLDLRDLALPLFDEDLEAREGLPPGGKKLRELMLANDGLLISSPEYNSSLPAVLKNAIDWASRKQPGDNQGLVCFTGKAAAIMSASPGALGGLRGLVHLRSILGNINVLMLPDQVSIPVAHEAIAPDGSLKDAKKQEAVEGLGRKLAELIRKIKSA